MLRVSVAAIKYDSPSFNGRDLKRIATKAIQVLRARVRKGLDVDDRRMPPLSPRYAAQKQKRGQEAVRNLTGSGSMLGSIAVIQASKSRAVIGFTRADALKKAQGNQRRRPWFGLSRKDEREVVRFARKILADKLHKS